MKKTTVISGLVSVVMTSVIVAGCETQSAVEKVFITPSSVTIRKNQSVEFTASGGFEYAWSLTSDTDGSAAWGILSTRTGNRTTYTSLRSASTNDITIKVLKVTSSVPSAGGSISNSSTLAEWTAEAFIYHR